MKKINLIQTKNEVSAVFVDAQLEFLRTRYTQHVWLNTIDGEIYFASFAATPGPECHLIDRVQEWTLGDWSDISGAALRSGLIKMFTDSYLSDYDRLKLDFEGHLEYATLYFLDDRYKLVRNGNKYRFMAYGVDMKLRDYCSELYSSKTDAWQAALDFDYSNNEIGLIDD